MIAVTLANIWIQDLKRIKYIMNARNEILDLVDNLDNLKGLETNYNGIEESVMVTIKSALFNAVRSSKTMLDLALRELIIFYDKQILTSSAYSEVFEIMHDTGQLVKSRGFNEAVTNFSRAARQVAQIYTCTKDKYDYDIESISNGLVTFETVQDRNTKQKAGQETITISPKKTGLNYGDYMELCSDMKYRVIRCYEAIQTTFLKDSSFKGIYNPGVGTASRQMTNITDFGSSWKLTTAIQIALWYTRTDKSMRLDGTSDDFALSLEVKPVAATTSIYTYPTRVFKRNYPYFWGIHYWLDNFFGVINVTLGSHTEVITVAGATTSTVWEMMKVDDKYSWFDNFDPGDGTNIKFTVEIIPNVANAGSVIFDDFFILPFLNISKDAEHYIIPLAAEDNLLIGDTATKTITYTKLPDGVGAANQANRQYANVMINRRYYPHSAAGTLNDDITSV